MKTYCKTPVLFTTFLFLFLLLVAPSFADSKVIENTEVKVIVNGNMTSNSDVPISINGKFMLPLNELLGKLGLPTDDAHIIRNDENQTVTLLMEQDAVKLNLGSAVAEVNGKTVNLDSAPVVYEKTGKIYVPFRFSTQAFSKHTEWDDMTRTIVICEEASFKASKAADQASLAAMLKLKNYQQEFTTTYTLKSTIYKFTIQKTVFPLLMSAKRVETVTSWDLTKPSHPKTVYKYETIYHGLKVYEKDSNSTKWTVKRLEKDEYATRLGLAHTPDPYLAGRMISEKPGSNEVTGIGYTPTSETRDYTQKFFSEITYDKISHFIKYEGYKLTGTSTEGEAYTLESSIVYGHYNDKVTFQLPKGIGNK